MPSKKQKQDSGDPKFPYAAEPQALRRLLTEIPKRPKPPKVSRDTLKAWNVSKSNNSGTAIGVLKKLGFLGPTGEPTDLYVEFMKTGVGPSVLAQRIRDVYRVLFENSHAPQNETNEELKKFFHIHSGGSEETMRLQMQTFKALADHASFSEHGASTEPKDQHMVGSTRGSSPEDTEHRLPPIQVDLHIHLPENKTTREYEAIIQ